MSTAYPGAIDSLVNPNATDPLSSPSHSLQHANANDAIEAIEKRVGPRGTSFPGSPASGDRFYRTDRKIEYEYDGTRWLSVSQHRVAIATNRALSPFSATGVVLDSPTPQAEDATNHFLEKIVYETNVNTTNNGSNFWTVDAVSGGGTSMGSFTTAADTVGTWTPHVTSVNAVYGSGVISVRILTKTGAPGVIFVTAYCVWRMVG